MVAVLTAGGRVDEPFAREIGTGLKALAPWRDGKLIDPAIAAARACGAARVVVIGDDAVAAHCAATADAVIPAQASGAENLEAALRLARNGESLLLLTSDLPFITAPALEHFLAHTGDAELAMPLATARAYTTAYPGASDHVTTLGGEAIANGNVFYFASADAAERSILIARRLFEARKSLIRMASLLEVPLLLRFCFRTLRIEHLEAYARRRFMIAAKAVRDAAPELCYDVDSLADYHYAKAHDARG